MNLRVCKVCESPMDPGEGQNGICEDCISKMERQRLCRLELDRMARSTHYVQEELFHGKDKVMQW